MLEEDEIEKKFEETDPISDWKDKNKSKHIFDNIDRLTNFQIVQFSPMDGTKNEPKDGTIQYNSKLYYFRYSHEFGNGNTYIVFDKNNNPISYFLLYTDYYGDIDSPMVSEEQF